MVLQLHNGSNRPHGASGLNVAISCRVDCLHVGRVAVGPVLGQDRPLAGGTHARVVNGDAVATCARIGWDRASEVLRLRMAG